MTSSTGSQLDALRANIAAHRSVAVAFSAGVDSTLVLKVATDVLGDRALGVMGVSPSVAPAETRDAESLSQTLGLPVLFVPTEEMRDPRYVANPGNRCFFCKTELYGVCARIARERGIEVVLNGTNADDLGDHRPGLVAAADAAVRSPLLECGLDKRAVRALALALGLPNHDKPALACLASRLPHGTTVTEDRLASVDAVESHMRQMGFRQVRARFHGPEVRLEVEPDRVPELQERLQDGEFAGVLLGAGFSRATVMPDGYRMGRLNEVRP